MPTVIDSLVLVLGLDTKNFTKEQRQALSELNKFQEESVKSGKKTEENAQRQLQFMQKLKREAVTLVAALAGANGIKQFVANMVAGDAATARFTRTTGLAIDKVAEFETAIELAGGAEGSGKGALKMFNDRLLAFKNNLDPQLITDLNNLMAQGANIPINPMGNLFDQLPAIAENARAAEAKVPGQGGFLLSKIGFDENGINLLIRGRDYLNQTLAAAKELNLVNKESAESAERLQRAWRETSKLLQGLARPAMPWLDDAIKKLNAGLQNAKKSQDENPTGFARSLLLSMSNPALLAGTVLTHMLPKGEGQDKNAENKNAKLDRYWDFLRGKEPTPPALPPAAITSGGSMFPPWLGKPMGWESGDHARFRNGESRSGGETINVNGPISITAPAGADGAGFADAFRNRLKDQSRMNATKANTSPE